MGRTPIVWRIEVKGDTDKGSMDSLERRIKRAIGQGANFIILQLEGSGGDDQERRLHWPSSFAHLKDENRAADQDRRLHSAGHFAGGGHVPGPGLLGNRHGRQRRAGRFLLPAELQERRPQAAPRHAGAAGQEAGLSVAAVRGQSWTPTWFCTGPSPKNGRRAAGSRPRRCKTEDELTRDAARQERMGQDQPGDQRASSSRSTPTWPALPASPRSSMRPRWKACTPCMAWIRSKVQRGPRRLARPRGRVFPRAVCRFHAGHARHHRPDSRAEDAGHGGARACWRPSASCCSSGRIRSSANSRMLAVLLFVLGIILLGVEIFVLPGFGFTGIAGIMLVMCSLALVTLEKWPSSSEEWMQPGHDAGHFWHEPGRGRRRSDDRRLVPAEHSVRQPPGAQPARRGSGARRILHVPCRCWEPSAWRRPRCGPPARPSSATTSMTSSPRATSSIAGQRVQVIEIEGNRIVVKEI